MRGFAWEYVNAVCRWMNALAILKCDKFLRLSWNQRDTASQESHSLRAKTIFSRLWDIHASASLPQTGCSVTLWRHVTLAISHWLVDLHTAFLDIIFPCSLVYSHFRGCNFCTKPVLVRTGLYVPLGLCFHSGTAVSLLFTVYASRLRPFISLPQSMACHNGPAIFDYGRDCKVIIATARHQARLEHRGCSFTHQSLDKTIEMIIQRSWFMALLLD